MPRRRSIYSLPKFRLRQATIITVGSLISIVLAGVSLVSLVSSSTMLDFWRQFLTSNLGWTAILSPILFLLSGLILQRFKWALAQVNVLVGLLVVMVALEGLTYFIVPEASGEIGSL